ncbi:MAG: hypothetical protein AAFO91_07645 [Bacteroidota bacterium]
MRLILLLATLALYTQLFAQSMNNERLGEILSTQTDTLEGRPGNWTFQLGPIIGMCITDERNNRMRIITPIGEMNTISEEEQLAALYANFHSALDVRYAAADGVMWAAFIHPLRELSDGQVEDAISQVFNAAITFGTTYNSTDLIFPGGSGGEEEPDTGKQNRSKRDGGRF